LGSPVRPRRARKPTIHAVIVREYFANHRAIFQLNRQTRQETKDFFFKRNAVRLLCDLDFNNNPNTNMVMDVVGPCRINHLEIDIHLVPNFDILGRVYLLAQCLSLEHLTVTVFGNDHSNWEAPWNVNNASIGALLNPFGPFLLYVLCKLKTIEINILNDANYDHIMPHLEYHFDKAQWMVTLAASVADALVKHDNSLRVLFHRGLAISKPIITTSSYQRYDVFDNRFWVQGAASTGHSPPPSPRKAFGSRHGLHGTRRLSVDL
jgi:hypothetical protein